MKTILGLTFACLVALTGCKDMSAVNAPVDFAELESGEHHAYRATNASGVVLAVREEPNEPKGSLEFWEKALDNKLRRSGYTRSGAERITTDAGLVGKQLRYEVLRGGRPTVYWVGVFVTDSRVIVVEAGGDTAFFDAETAKHVNEAFRSLREG